MSRRIKVLNLTAIGGSTIAGSAFTAFLFPPAVTGSLAAAVVAGYLSRPGVRRQESSMPSTGIRPADSRTPLENDNAAGNSRRHFHCVPSMTIDLEVEVLWGVGRNDPSEPQGEDRE